MNRTHFLQSKTAKRQMFHVKHGKLGVWEAGANGPTGPVGRTVPLPAAVHDGITMFHVKQKGSTTSCRLRATGNDACGWGRAEEKAWLPERQQIRQQTWNRHVSRET